MARQQGVARLGVVKRAPEELGGDLVARGWPALGPEEPAASESWTLHPPALPLPAAAAMLHYRHA
jgi:hypothetical protein